MEMIEKNKNQFVFKAEISESLANSIRRYVGKIPVFALENIEISKNGSPLYDETLAHRIGLVPIKNVKGLKEDKTELTLKTKKEGYVYSEEIKGDAEVAIKGIPLTILDKSQEIELKANGVFGTGSEHAKFSPGLMVYRKNVDIILDKSLLEEIKKNFPNNKIKEKGNKIIIQDDQKVEIADACEIIAKETGKSIEFEDKNELIILIESFGQLDAEKIFKEAISTLKKDLEGTSKLLSK